MRRKQPRYNLRWGEGDGLMIPDLKTNEIIPYRTIASRKDGTIEWMIMDEKGNSRYFTEIKVETNGVRTDLAGKPQEENKVQNKVESTIF